MVLFQDFLKAQYRPSKAEDFPQNVRNFHSQTTVLIISPSRNSGALKGLGFSRAEDAPLKIWALAPGHGMSIHAALVNALREKVMPIS
jgi:hypothetical protein